MTQERSTLPRNSKFSIAPSRPAWATQRQRQAVIVNSDHSTSMRGKKGKQSTRTIRTFASILAGPENKDAFDLAVVRFSTNAEVVLPLEPATSAVNKIESPGLLNTFGGWTNIREALEFSEHILDGLKSDESSRAPSVVVLFTDGCHNQGEGPAGAADRLKARGVTLACIAYGDDADEDLLERLASPQCFVRCSDGTELRNWFCAAAKSLSISLARGVHPAQGLASIPRSSPRST